MFCDILASAANPLARFWHGIDAHVAQCGLAATLANQAVYHVTVFLHQHGIRPSGDRRTGEYSGGSLRVQGFAAGTGRNALAHLQQRPQMRHVGTTHCITVHGTVVNRRHVQGGHHVLRQHAAIGLEG